MEINEEKRKKFMEYAGKRVNNVMHDIQILEPMARSNSYDFTKEDVEKMFFAMQDALNATKAEFEKKFEEKARTEKKVFSFETTSIPKNLTNQENVLQSINNVETNQIKNNIETQLEGNEAKIDNSNVVKQEVIENENNELNNITNIF